MAAAESAVSKQQNHFLEDSLQNVSILFIKIKNNIKTYQDAKSQ